MGSLEDLFEREEFSWHSYQDAKYVLSRHNKNKLTGPQENLAIQLGEPLRIREEIKVTEDFDDLKTLRKEAEGLDISKARKTLTNEINKKMESVSKELARISEQRKEERLILEREEKEKSKIEERRADIQADIDKASSLGDIRKAQKRIDNLREVTDVSDLESQAEGMVASYQEQQLTGELKRQAKAEQRARIEETGEGLSPDF